MLVNGRHYRSVWMEKNIVYVINQKLLPQKFEILGMKTVEEVADAIQTMVIRGAPAIGASGAYGVALAMLTYAKNGFSRDFEDKISLLKSTRPTAHDLFHAIDYVLDSIRNETDINKKIKAAKKSAEEYANQSIKACKSIGMFGSELIKDGFRIATHCNAGWLATVDWGTALSPIYFAKRQGKRIKVFVDETRPVLQGARLTSWELRQEGIEHYVISDNALGYLMKKGEIDLMIVGADRIAKNGDVANKIGTYEKALVSKDNHIPFFVAAPTSTLDLKCKSGSEIPIEERSEEEVHYVYGFDDKGEWRRLRTTPKGVKARNPAFDITPAKYITGIITENGIFKPHNIEMALR
ncbi:MAG: S-methyl-5-thioribose-1-phosphate isomerase [Candidatus Aenigmarchaeota archaeon]|nr:S-methyl-5-thioribose-1-phosphate isomerase [Candidatus Aenigmarchaeota archaeon]